MKYLFSFVLIIYVNFCSAQSPALIFKSSTTGEIINNVTIYNGAKAIGIANSAGNFKLDAGKYLLRFSATGFEFKSDTIVFPLISDIVIRLIPVTKTMEEVLVVSSTRNNQRIENAPMKVEVLGREELDEENTIKPANISSLLGDISGVQLQQTSATSNNTVVKIQGLDGRYTQVLRDGMPIFEGFSGSFGVMSVPPIDLKQIELIKGSASTLYGGGAIAGIVNLISRKPSEKPINTFTVNYSSLGEKTYNSFLSHRHKKFGYTFFIGSTKQKEQDVNKDIFSDLPRLSNFLIHPKVFWYPGKKTTLSLGYVGQLENRKGGDMDYLAGSQNNLHRFFENNNVKRNGLEFIVDHTLSSAIKISFKNNFAGFYKKFSSTEFNMSGRQLNRFSELSAFIHKGNASFVIGANSLADQFTKKSTTEPVLWGNFSNSTVGLFGQSTWNITDNNVFEAGVREDFHSKYGSFFLPRVALFHRFNEAWASRAGVGLGYNIPNLFTNTSIELPIQYLHPLTSDMQAEKSVGVNLEVNYKKEWGEENRIFINQAFFMTTIQRPVTYKQLFPSMYYQFYNAANSVVTKGFDTYISATLEGFEIYAGYTYTMATRNYMIVNKAMPLTPMHRAAFTLVREWESKGFRVGLESSYNGSQHRLDGSSTFGYLFMAAMADKKIGTHLRIVINCENLLDYRQSKVESLYTGTISNPQFKELWAPIDGRVANLAIFISI